MEIEITEHVVRIVVIAPAGRLDAYAAPELKQELEGLIEEGAVKLVLDLKNVEFMDSAGMAVLVSALKRTRSAAGDVVLTQPQSADTMRILTLTKLDRVFKIFEEASEAVKAF